MEQTIPELEASLGENLRTLRLLRNLDQATLANQAGVSKGALGHLERGEGATLKTFIAVLKALGMDGSLNSLAPVVRVSPLSMPKGAPLRQRARRPNKTV